MAGKKYQIDTPNGSVQHLSEEQLVIAGISAELAAASESCSRIARMRAEIGGAQWRGVVAGTAEELGFLADRIHDTRIALQAFAAENSGDPDAPTHRELQVAKERKTRMTAFLVSLGGTVSSAAMWAANSGHPKLAAVLTGSAFLIGLLSKQPIHWGKQVQALPPVKG